MEEFYIEFELGDNSSEYFLKNFNDDIHAELCARFKKYTKLGMMPRVGDSLFASIEDKESCTATITYITFFDGFIVIRINVE